MTNYNIARGAKRNTMNDEGFVRVGRTAVYNEGPALSQPDGSQMAGSQQRVRTLRQVEFDHGELHSGFCPAGGWKAAVERALTNTMVELGFFLGLSGELSAREVTVNRCVLVGLLGLLVTAPLVAAICTQARSSMTIASDVASASKQVHQVVSAPASVNAVSGQRSINSPVVVMQAIAKSAPGSVQGFDSVASGPPVCINAENEPLTVQAEGASAMPVASQKQIKVISADELFKQYPELTKYIPQSNGQLIGQAMISQTR